MKYAAIPAALLLTFMAFLSFGAALHESPAFDEVAHIGAGLSYVDKFDLRLNPEHPPLTKALSGIALKLHGTYADFNAPAWNVSKDFLPAFLGQWSFGESLLSRWNNSETTLAWARFPMLLLTLALGWAIFKYSTWLGGSWAGLICLAVYVSAPVFLAFGPLVITDIPIALFSLLSVWTFASLRQNPTPRNILMFTLSLSGAFLSKFSALIVLLGILVSALTTRWFPIGDQPTRWRATFKGLLLTLLLVYAFYLILSWNQPTNSLQRLGTSLPALALRRLLLPPATYFGGMFLVLFTFGRSTFLLGHAYPKGVWFYYPVVFALKSQLGFLGLLLLSLVLGLTRKRVTNSSKAIPSELRMHWRTIWVTLVVFVSVCVLSHFDISIRHFSVPLALLILTLAPIPRLLIARPKAISQAGSIATALLVLSCLFTAARAYPWFLPYVNALGAGKLSYTLMSDSNIDWNQALPEARHFAERHQLHTLALDSYGMFDDKLYVPQSHPWDCQAPAPADANHWVVVSANLLLDAANCFWITRYPQEQLAGGSMYAFYLPSEIPPDGTLGGPPLAAERRTFLNLPFDIKATGIQTSRHPESIPQVLKQMQKATTPPVEINKATALTFPERRDLGEVDLLLKSGADKSARKKN